MRRFSLLPLVCYGAMFAYACYGLIIVGHWPYYAHPDPKELPGRPLLYVVSVMLLIGAGSIVLLPAVYAGWRSIVHLRRLPLSPHRRWVLWYIAGVAVWAVDFAALHGRMPWHSVISWIVD